MAKDQSDYIRFIRECLESGDDPNEIEGHVRNALRSEAQDWVLFGDGEWREDTVCPECGSWIAGICGHKQEPILRSQYLLSKGENGG